MGDLRAKTIRKTYASLYSRNENYACGKRMARPYSPKCCTQSCDLKTAKTLARPILA